MVSLTSPVNSQDAVLALDIGTSSVRCLAFDAEGQQIPGLQSARAHEVRYLSDGGAELDPESILSLAVQCLAEVSARIRGRILAVGLSTFWHAFLGVDEACKALTPVYLWNDTRSAGQAARLRRQLDASAVHQRTGCVLHPSYLPARLLWLSEKDKALFARCLQFISIGEYIVARLLGTRRCSFSMASGTGLFNQATEDWDGELMETLNLDSSRFFPLCQEHISAEGLCATWDRELPRLKSTPFFPALGDGACNNLGSGAQDPRRAALMVGTSAAIRLLFNQNAPPAPQGLWRYLLDSRRILIGGAISNAGGLYAWLRKTLNLPEEAELEAALTWREPASHGLQMLPFLAGERNPDYPLEAEGMLRGLRSATTSVDILQAGLEAATYRLAAIADLLRIAQPGLEGYLASGGFLRSKAWTQLAADVLGLPLSISPVQEASARGAALMALEALGFQLNAGFSQELPCIEPNLRHHERHRQARAEHEQLYQQTISSGIA